MYENMLLTIELLISGIHCQHTVLIVAPCWHVDKYVDTIEKHMSIKLESETAK